MIGFAAWRRALRLGVCALLVAGCRKDERPPAPVGPASEPAKAATWFTDVTHNIGLDFVYENGAKGAWLLPEIMGAGVALFDYDGDGDLDIYLTNGNRAFPDLSATAHTRNRLFRHESDGRFVDMTAVSGLGDTGYGMGVAIGDTDNDGHPDVYLTNFGPDRLYRNLGRGRFEDVTEAAGIAVAGWSASACFFDYDLDGFLDLYIAQYLKWYADKKCFTPIGQQTYCGPLDFLPVHDVLYHNNGDGTFRDVTEAAGIASVAAAGLGVVCEDFNEDRWPDIYVANDAFANHLWVNRGDGTFRDAALEMGCAYNRFGGPEAGMGVIAGDFDNDGDSDLFMTHLDGETNTLYRNLGAGLGFTDTTSEVGLGRSSLPYTGFGTAAFDAELDGDLDLAVVNGRVKHGEPWPNVRLPPPWNVLGEPNLFYVNNGSGRFELLGVPAAAICDPVEITRGLAVGDLDEDGDVDLVISNIGSPTRVYRCDAPRQGSWLIVTAWDPRLQRQAIGARITVVCSGQRLVRTVSRAYSYLSSSDPRAHFGLGASRRIDRIEVEWPDGLRERFPPPSVNARVTLVRGTGNKE